MKRIVPVLLIGLYEILIASTAHAIGPQVGRCMMGNCVWTKILNKELLKEKGGASLYKVQYQEGIAPLNDDSGHCYKDDNFDESEGLKKSIHWYSPNTAFVFCSNKLPSVITTIAKIIPVTLNGVEYGRANGISTYAPVCHNVPVKQFLSKKFLDDHHYQESGLEMIMIKNPYKMFDLLDPKVLEAHENKF